MRNKEQLPEALLLNREALNNREKIHQKLLGISNTYRTAYEICIVVKIRLKRARNHPSFIVSALSGAAAMPNCISKTNNCREISEGNTKFNAHSAKISAVSERFKFENKPRCEGEWLK